MDAVAPPHRRNTAPSAARLELRNGKWEIDRFELPTAASRHHLLLRLLGRRQRGASAPPLAPPPPPVREAGARHTTCRSVRAAGASAAPVPPLKAGGRRTRAASVDLNYLRVGRERPLPCTVKVLLVLHTAFSAGPTRRRTQGTEEASSSARRGATRRRPLRCAGERSRHSCDSSPPLTYRIHAPTTCSSP